MSDTITVGQLVQRTQRWLVGLHGVPMNRLHDAVDETIDELKLSDALKMIQPGMYIGLGDEIVYVWETTVGNNTMVVSRGQSGTEAVPHPAGETIESSARFPRAAVKDALQEEIRSWPNSVYRPAAKMLDLPPGAGVIDAGLTDSRLLVDLALDRAPTVGGGKWTPLTYRLDRLMDRDVFASGNALTIYNRESGGGRARFLYGAPFDVSELDDDLDVVDDWGLARTMFDIPPMGAAARLLQTREIIRTETEAMQESRIAAEVPPTYQTQTATTLRLAVARRLGEEALRLRRQYEGKA